MIDKQPKPSYPTHPGVSEPHDLDDKILMHALNKSFGIKPGYGLIELAIGVTSISFVTEDVHEIFLAPIPNSDIRVGYDELQNMIYISRGNK
jgi:hypothetical protein